MRADLNLFFKINPQSFRQMVVFPRSGVALRSGVAVRLQRIWDPPHFFTAYQSFHHRDVIGVPLIQTKTQQWVPELRRRSFLP